MYHVYALTHTPTGKVYVGLTNTDRLEIHAPVGLPRRFAEHLNALEREDHFNDDLQATWAGSYDDYDFRVIEDLGDMTKSAALKVENEWMKAFPEVFNIRGVKRVAAGWPRKTNEERDEVRRLLAKGFNGKQVAAMTGLSTGTVSLIKNGKDEEHAVRVAARKAAKAAEYTKWFNTVVVPKVLAEPVFCAGHWHRRIHIRNSLEKHGYWSWKHRDLLSAALAAIH